jgi:hypothetical protein
MISRRRFAHGFLETSNSVGACFNRATTTTTAVPAAGGDGVAAAATPAGALAALAGTAAAAPVRAGAGANSSRLLGRCTAGPTIVNGRSGRLTEVPQDPRFGHEEVGVLWQVIGWNQGKESVDDGALEAFGVPVRHV